MKVPRNRPPDWTDELAICPLHSGSMWKNSPKSFYDDIDDAIKKGWPVAQLSITRHSRDKP